MKLHPTVHRLIAGSLTAALAVATLAPAANAGHGWGQSKKYRRGEYPVSNRVSYAPQRSVEYRHYSNGNPGLIGFLGGLAVGAILTSAVQAHAQPQRQVYQTRGGYDSQNYCPPPRDGYSGNYSGGYSYEDPYSNQRYASLDVYLAHERNCRHEMVVRVIDNRGDCVETIRYNGGQWQSCGRGYQGNWNDRQNDNRDNGQNGNWDDNQNDNQNDNWNDNQGDTNWHN